MGSSERSLSKSVTRILQHSILQLCNEHIGYSHKLQILGVLCMTVDDEQQELVVKVNNTLKRVNPAASAGNDAVPPPPVLAPAVAPVAPLASSGTYPQGPDSMENMFSLPRTASPSQMLPSNRNPDLSPQGSPAEMAGVGGGRKSHGRKRMNPVKIQQVYDEGDLVSSDDDDDDQNVLTVIPTDPEGRYDPVQAASRNSSYQANNSAVSPSPSKDHKPHGSAKRKGNYQCRVRHSPDRPSSNSPQASPKPRQCDPESLPNTSTAYSDQVEESGAQDLSTHKGLRYSEPEGPTGSGGGGAGLTLPVTIPGETSLANGEGSDSQDSDSARLDVDGTMDESVDGDEESRLVIDMYEQRQLPKEEPGDDYSYAANSTSNSYFGSSQHPSAAEDLSQHLAMQNYPPLNDVAAVAATAAHLGRNQGLPTQVPYALAFAAPSPSKKAKEGLTVQYTSTGPITVGANGKNVSQSPSRMKVKDIILYDDTTPLNEQRGNRIETDYMLDAMGLEGRKRRRRATDETLTADEIAEYMGSVPDRGNNMTFKCKYCNEELGSVTGYLQHTLSVHHAYICHQCGKSFTTKSSLLRHRPIHTGMRRFACSICKKTFYRKDKCKAHIKRHLGEAGEQARVERCDQPEAIDA